MLAPKDVQPISFEAKNNTHGIGYSGINPSNALFLGADSLAKAFKPTGSEKRGIRGQVCCSLLLFSCLLPLNYFTCNF